MTKPLDAAGVMKMMKDKEVKYVDLRFTDPRGKMQHLTMDVSQMGEEAWADGLMFDGSSISGWKAINESDMVLMPDPSSAHMDPFYAQTTMAVFCDILDPGTGCPVAHWQSVSVVAPLCVVAGSCATIAMLMGPDAESFLREQGLRYVAVDADGRLRGAAAEGA